MCDLRVHRMREAVGISLLTELDWFNVGKVYKHHAPNGAKAQWPSPSKEAINFGNSSITRKRSETGSSTLPSSVSDHPAAIPPSLRTESLAKPAVQLPGH